MSPIELIADGIRNNNWENVCEGYKNLTGEWIVPPPYKSDVFKDTLKKINKIIFNTLKNKGENIEIEKEKKINKKKRKKKKSSTVVKDELGSLEIKEHLDITKDGEDSSIIIDENKKTSIQKEAGETQLITNEPDENEIIKNREKAQKVMYNKTRFKRRAPKMYDVKCNECEQIFQSHRQNIDLGQKCNKCLNARISAMKNG